MIDLSGIVAIARKIDLSGIKDIAREQEKTFRRINRQLEPLRQFQESIHQQLEPFHQIQESVHQQLEPLRQARENIQKTMLPVERAVRQFSRIQIRVPSLHSFPSRPNSDLSVADTTTDLTIFPDDHHQDIGVIHHQFEQKNAHMSMENETLRSQISHLQSIHTEHRKKGGRKRHEKTNLIKNKIIQPIFYSGVIKGQSPRQVAINIHDMFQPAKYENATPILKSELMELSTHLRLDENLLSQAVAYFSGVQDTLKTLYNWCLFFENNRMFH